MKVAILGYGVEGKATEKYFQSHPYVYKENGEQKQVGPNNLELTVFDDFTAETLPDLSDFDVIFRSPSVKPSLITAKISPNSANKPVVTSITEYFFSQVDPRHIIGVTGTKGKGTTCSLTIALLKSLSYETFLVGNIGAPAIEALDEIAAYERNGIDNFFIVYEMSSFQLWTLEKSPHTSVVLRISPDHLDVHQDFNEYTTAKSNIARHQTQQDTCIYYGDNPDSQKIAQTSPGKLIAYPLTNTNLRDKIDGLLNNLQVPGAHNRENAEAALLAVSAATNTPVESMLTEHQDELARALANFESLPHRIQFVRELNGVKYYDDNYSSALPAAEVAIKAFSDQPVVLIAGGKDRNLDLTGHKQAFFSSKNVKKTILIGEIKTKLAEGIDETKYEFADNLRDAVLKAKSIAESLQESGKNPVVLMSPGAASFDMFKNFNDRGEQFQAIVKELN